MSAPHPRLTAESLARDEAEIGLPAIVRTLLRNGCSMSVAPFHAGAVALGIELGVIERPERYTIAAAAAAPEWLRIATVHGWFDTPHLRSPK